MTYKKLDIAICKDCHRLVSYRFVDGRGYKGTARDILLFLDHCGVYGHHTDPLVVRKQKMILK